MAQKKTVCVLFGGQSTEHEVSCISAASVITHLDSTKYDIMTIGITKDGRWLHYQGPQEKIANGEWQSGLVNRVAITPDASEQGIMRWREDSQTGEIAATKAKIDVVFPVLHGKYGEDGTVQGLLELANIPYVGTGVLCSAVSMDKAFAKIIFKQAGIAQADWLVVDLHVSDSIDDHIQAVEKQFTYPCFVKPANTGSSIGISKAHNRVELSEAINYAAKFDHKILVEEFINGREVECAVLGNAQAQASVVGEIEPANEFYDYDAKYHDAASKLTIPAQLDERTTKEIQALALRAFHAVDGSGLSRVDFFVQHQTGKVYINEINTLPGFTSISMYPKLWEASGIGYSELLDRLIALAFEKKSKN
ncbi:MAG: D-alanine--D-alanine ligase [Hyphomonadaceae bacterium]|nr:D-alanine--D-alanine ligase [Clostridia bacterium]